MRRGLPRVAGGEPWPPAGSAAGHAQTTAAPVADTTIESQPEVSAVPATTLAPATAEPTAAQVASSAAQAPATDAPATAADASAEAGSRAVRRGLPRVPGGEPWPSAASVPPSAAPAPATPAAAPAAAPEPAASTPSLEDTTPAEPVIAAAESAPDVASDQPISASAPAQESAAAEPSVEEPVVAAPAAAATAAAEPASTPAGSPAAAPAKPAAAQPQPAPAKPARTKPTKPAPAKPALAKPAPAKPAAAKPAPADAPGLRPVTPRQWIAAGTLVALAVVGAATIAVAIGRWFTGLEPVAGFIGQYSGTYELPEGAPVGLPAWLNWSHFFNVLLIVLIIRSGLQVRNERKPAAYFTSRRNGKKVSISVWLHTSLDVLWVVNGLIFVVLLFATGQWMRIVPTSFEVFPHAISAGLQYISLDWPVEDGWVNYNALQQIAYFVTVFIAAPVAIITGVRMSGWWPQGNERLDRAYPIEWARAVHFPTMLYFVVFIVTHVLLVMTTGALRNLNHMYAARPSDDWLGFIFFAGSMLVIAAAWIAARPSLLTPIASRFGTVSGR